MCIRSPRNLLVMSFFLLIAAYTATGKIIYVDADAQGPVYDGSSWADAYKYLQDALVAASSGDEIRVAQGIYRPHEPVQLPPPPPPPEPPVPPPPPDRTATFQLRNGVVIRGGYAGFGELSPNARNIELYETILTGDLYGNDIDVNDPYDLFDEPTRTENSYHVVTASQVDQTSILDGFTIAAGNANNGDLYSLHQLGGGMYNYEASPTVIDCTFVCNSAVAGGGMYNYEGSPTLRNCSFIGNSAHKVLYDGGCGGGMYTSPWASHPEVANCVFEGNSAASGGGIMSHDQAVITDCIFRKNSGGGMWFKGEELKGCTFTLNRGGGLFIGGDTHLSNCLFSGNIGGAALQAQDCDIVITNCSFIGNITSAFFAGIWNDGGDTTVTNCILWGNIGIDGVTESAQIATHDPAVINYCCIQGWTGVLGGTGNSDADPCFVSEGCWDTLPDFNEDYWYRHINWINGDYHLLPDSACIDAGDNLAVPPSVTTDLDGNPRIRGQAVDMGVYESPAVYFVDIDATGANNGSSWSDAFNRIEDAIAVALEGDEIRLAQGTYRPTPPPPYQAVNPTPADGVIEVSTTADLSWTAGSGAMSHDVYFGTASPGLFQGNQTGTSFDTGIMAPGITYYWRIDEVSTWGTTTGEVWSFTTIVGPPPSVPLVVAATGASETSLMEHCRLATFVLKEDVILRGGYAGCGEPDPDTRDIEVYKTILSGDMNGDDVEVNDPCDMLTDPSRADNCYHVLTAIEIGYYGGPNTILDGFTITGGNADGQYPDTEEHGYGGGMYNKESSPVLINCTFIENSARYSGGGMDNDRGWPMLIKCAFSRNFSNWGGGLANGDGRPTLIDSTFVENVSSYKGGATANYDGSPPMNNCSFINNRAVIGGAIYGGDSYPKATDCTFTGNSAEKGGVVYNNDSSVLLTNCTLSGNSATEGGVIYDDEGGSILVNCTLTANTAVTGGVMYSRDDSYVRLTNCIGSGNSAASGGVIYSDDSFVRLTNCTLCANSADNGNALASDSYQQQNPSSIEMTNCVLWDGGSEIWNNDGSTISITYSDVQGGWVGEGNIDADPLFVEPGYWDAGGVWIEGDYRLRAGSLCIDAGIDAGVYGDIDGAIRPFDFPGIDNNGELPDFDMGAYEAIATIQGELLIQPNKVNLNARSKKFFAVIRLPKPVVESDIDMSGPLVLYPGHIEADEQKLLLSDETEEDGVRIRAVFDRADLLAAMSDQDNFEVTVIGRFVSGENFYGTDNIRIVSSSR